MKVKSESEVAQSCPTLSDPWTAPSMGFSRQEYWSGVPLPYLVYIGQVLVNMYFKRSSLYLKSLHNFILSILYSVGFESFLTLKYKSFLGSHLKTKL